LNGNTNVLPGEWTKQEVDNGLRLGVLTRPKPTEVRFLREQIAPCTFGCEGFDLWQPPRQLHWLLPKNSVKSSGQWRDRVIAPAITWQTMIASAKPFNQILSRELTKYAVPMAVSLLSSQHWAALRSNFVSQCYLKTNWDINLALLCLDSAVCNSMTNVQMVSPDKFAEYVQLINQHNQMAPATCGSLSEDIYPSSGGKVNIAYDNYYLRHSDHLHGCFPSSLSYISPVYLPTK